MAEQMQPALLVTAHPAKKARKRKPEAEKAAMKKALDKERSRSESTSALHLSGGNNWGMQLQFESATAQYSRQLASRCVLVSTQSVLF